nr:hypothetical protein [Tanacetum cinerariifolium]
QAAKRLRENLQEEAEALGDSPSMVHPKKRIILTTQLMQRLVMHVAWLSGKNDISKGSGDQNLSKIVEDLIARAKKLEDKLLRRAHMF